MQEVGTALQPVRPMLWGRSWRDMVVMMAANNWDGVRFQDRQLAESLAKYVPVLYVDPPMSRLSTRRRPELAESLREPRLRMVAPGLARLTPVVAPAMERRGMASLTRLLMAAAVRRAVKALRGSVHALIETSSLVPVLGRCGEEVRVYWAQDDFVGGAELLGLSAARIARGEQHNVDRADVVVAANPSVAESLRKAGHDPVLIPYGCDTTLFSTTQTVTPADDVRLPAPMAGFMGHLADRIDLALIEAVAARGVSMLLVGPRHPRYALDRMAALLKRSNVQWVGSREFESLPTYLRHVNVGLVPYTSSAFNVGSFPLKTLEYLASGLPVVATDLPAIRWLDCPDITIARSPDRFAEEVERALDMPLTQTAIDGRRGFAARHSWDHRARAFLQALQLPLSGVDPEAKTSVGQQFVCRGA